MEGLAKEKLSCNGDITVLSSSINNIMSRKSIITCVMALLTKETNPNFKPNKYQRIN